MAAGVRVKQAQEPDIAEIMAILEARRAWLRDTKDSDQWDRVAEWRYLLRYLIRHGNVWVLVTDDANEWIVGTVSVSTEPDIDFWTEAERKQPALYLSKLATDVGRKGQELGAVLLHWALEHAADRGLGMVRLDTWKTSTGLQRYYTDRDWRYVRTPALAHRQSGALFERAASISWEPNEVIAHDDQAPSAAASTASDA